MRNILFPLNSLKITYPQKIRCINICRNNLSTTTKTFDHLNAAWFKKIDPILYVCISWTIHGMWMIYITFERGGLNFQIPPLECSPSAQPCSSVIWEQNDYYAAQELALQFWPSRSPDLTPCDFLLWGFVTEAVYVPSLPTTLDDLKNRITTAVNSVTQDILLSVWNKLATI